MPRVALTKDQRRRNAIQGICKSILDELNAKRGRERKTNQDFAGELGISPTTWYRWNNGYLSQAEFGSVLDVALRAGIRLEVVTK